MYLVFVSTFGSSCLDSSLLKSPKYLKINLAEYPLKSLVAIWLFISFLPFVMAIGAVISFYIEDDEDDCDPFK
jgi:hypothetical protein